MDAICTAARFGDSLIGSTLYMVCKDVQRHGQYWGSAPCLSCAKHVIASGVRRVVTIDTSPNLAAVQMASISACAPPSRWVPEVLAGQAMLEEAGVLYEEVPYGSLTL
jgi:deoxycytidylate deaminase